MGKAKRKAKAPSSAAPAVRAEVTVSTRSYSGLDDPALLEFIRGGSGGPVSIEAALENSAVLRCLDLISGSIGMLPLYIMRRAADGGLRKAAEHPLYRLFQYRPNAWQTPFEFKQLMQLWALEDGNAYALVNRIGARVSGLIPISPRRVQVRQLDDWSLSYQVTRPDGQSTTVAAHDMFHLRGLSQDGIVGLSRVKKAAGIIGTALRAQEASERLFRHGIMATGALKHPAKIGPEAVEQLRRSMEERYAGVSGAGRWMILEEGMEAVPFTATAENSQLVETRAAQVEEIARVFGVPRPLMGVEETSWGSGIEQLAILFVRFGLAPWFKAWEEAIRRTLVAESEWEAIVPDFDEQELLRGTLKDQSEFFAKALGSGGSRPWLEVNEVRELSGYGRHADGGGLQPAQAPAPTPGTSRETTPE